MNFLTELLLNPIALHRTVNSSVDQRVRSVRSAAKVTHIFTSRSIWFINTSCGSIDRAERSAPQTATASGVRVCVQRVSVGLCPQSVGERENQLSTKGQTINRTGRRIRLAHRGRVHKGAATDREVKTGQQPSNPLYCSPVVPEGNGKPRLDSTPTHSHTGFPSFHPTPAKEIVIHNRVRKRQQQTTASTPTVSPTAHAKYEN